MIIISKQIKRKKINYKTLYNAFFNEILYEKIDEIIS